MVYKVKTLTTNLKNENLINPMGIVIQKTNTISRCPEIWVTNNGSNTVSHFDLNGHVLNPTNINTANLPPTGIVYNSTSGFLVSDGVQTPLPSTLIAATQDGHIIAWNNAINSNTFYIVYTADEGTVYTGLEIYGGLIYATDFGGGKVDVIDSTWTLQTGFSFSGVVLPLYKPFNIALINQQLVVSYALNDENVPVKGNHFGMIDVFNVDGTFIRRLETFINDDNLTNVPYGLVSFSKEFNSKSKNTILVGNFGDGELSIYNDISGRYIETLKDKCSDPIFIPGLWGLARYKDVIYFVAGDFNEQSGVFGYIENKE